MAGTFKEEEDMGIIGKPWASWGLEEQGARITYESYFPRNSPLSAMFKLKTSKRQSWDLIRSRLSNEAQKWKKWKGPSSQTK